MASHNARLRPPPLSLPARGLSPSSADSDESDSSPDQDRDEEASYFLTLGNESQSTICPVVGGKEDAMDIDTEQLHRLTPISKLPPELLITIFSKLTTTADLRNCMLVSYHWALYSVSILWHRPLCNKWSNLQNVARALADSRPTFHYNEMVKRLNLSAVADKVNDGTAQAFMHCKNIERLTLTSCAKLSDFGVVKLVEGSKRLQALDVTGLDALTDRTLMAVASNCSKLQGLNITNCKHVTDESLVAIAEQCRQLKRLKLNGVLRATDQSITAVARNCRSILEIDLAGCELITSESVTALLSNLPYLRELRLVQCTDITDTAFTNLPPKLHFDALRILDLTQCEQVKDDAIARIIPAAPRLRNLVLSKCRHITDRAVDAICKLTKNLHYIHLGHCINLTDAAVINLVKHCNRIRYIDLACCSRLTDASVRHLAQLPKLRRIGLVKCQNLTDSSILALAHGPLMFNSAGKTPVPSQFVSLERVHLSYCVNLTLKGITALLHNCPRLTHLSLTGVQAFLREDLTRFCRDAPPEFTHPQRDVFCVFSGEGVTRLRDHLTRLAIEEAEREHQNAIEENLLDPEDSPGADTMSDDGTIDGHEHGGDVVYGPGRHGFPSVSGARRPYRPRSMQNLSNRHIDTPVSDHEHTHRGGTWTPDGPLTPNFAPAHQLHHAHAGLLGLPDMSQNSTLMAPLDFDRTLGEPSSSRSQTRRHTLESTPAFYTPPVPGNNAFAASASRPRGAVADDPRASGPPNAITPPTPRSGSGQVPRLRPDLFQSPSFLRPEPEYSAFDANHEAIMSTIPSTAGQHQSASQSSSSYVARAPARSRITDIFGSMRALSSSPLGHGESGARGSRSSRREYLAQRADAYREAHMREAQFRHARAAMLISRSQTDLPHAEPDQELEMPLLPADMIEAVPASQSAAAAQAPSAGPPMNETSRDPRLVRDVDMTQ